MNEPLPAEGNKDGKTEDNRLNDNRAEENRTENSRTEDNKTADTEKNGQTDKRKETLNEIHLVRALAILAVLIVHATSQTVADLEKSTTLYPFYNFMNIFFKYGTPTFIFLSAFVLFYNYVDRKQKQGLIHRFYRRRLKFVVLPYLVFSIVYFVASDWMFPVDQSWTERGKAFLVQLLTGKAHTHLYFVFVSIQFYVLFPLLLYIVWLKPRLLKHAFWAGAMLQWLFVLLNHYFWQIDAKGSIALSYISFYFAGAWMGVYFRDFLSWMERGWKFAMWIIWVVFGLLHVHAYHMWRIHGIALDTKWFELVWHMHTLATALVLFHFCFWVIHKLPERLTSLLIRLGLYSFGIYLIHPLILMVYRPWIITSSVWAYHAMVAAGGLLALTLSALIVHVSFRHWNHAWILFGQPPPHVRSVAREVRDEKRRFMI